jgi:hypothetical protein
MKKFFTILMMGTAFCAAYAQDTIRVPLDYSTIQAGINAATNGDLVLVEDGTYIENINYRGKAITIASMFLVDGDNNHINNTIIDGSQPSHPDSGSVVYFVSGEDTNSVLCGFTITSGTGTYIPAGPLPFNTRIGGGIYIDNDMGARIINNIIEQNEILSNDAVAGGGIYSEGPIGNGYTIIENNIIRNNTASGEITFTMGGGICIGGNGRIVKNKVSGNECRSVNADVVGGGIRIWLLDGTQDTAYCLVEDNIIIENKSVSVNGSAHAAGLNSNNTVVTVGGNTIANNIVETNVESWGVAMHLGGIRASESQIVNNHFKGNHFVGSGIVYGGAIYIFNSHPKVFNNIVDNNEANFGGGFYLGNDSQPEMTNNTIILNMAGNLGGGIYSNQSSLTLLNSILWGNTAPGGPQIYNSGGSVNVNYSDVEGGWSGLGNINSDPLFVFGDTIFHLSEFSPCTDEGIDSIEISGIWYHAPLFDIDGETRPYGNGFDMGSDEWYPISGAEGGNAIVPASFKLLQNYPNPFNPSTKISWQSPVGSWQTLKVYDVLGNEVAKLIDEYKSAGSYEVEFDGSSLSSGVYFYQLRAGSFVEAKKMILLR